MQLYSSAISPYSARCRIQIHHKALPVAIVAPPGGLGSAELKARNPNGKIPVLDLGDRCIAESWAIMEYLEATQPQAPMLPADPYLLARLREIVRFTDLYLAFAMFPLFRALRGAVGPEGVKEAMTSMTAQFRVFEQLLEGKARLALPAFDLADAALLPVVWYARILARHFGTPDCLAGLPATQAWWAAKSAVPAAAKVLKEMDDGLRAALPVLFAS